MEIPPYFIDPLLPAPNIEEEESGRRLGGPFKSVQLQADYDVYCTLYREYVSKRAPFFRKPEWIPHPETGRVQGWEDLLALKLQAVGGDKQDTSYTDMEARRGAVQTQYRALFQSLGNVIEQLADCDYVHNFSNKSRVVALYDYPGQGGVAHDISGAKWMFPVPGGQQVKQAQLSTTYFGSGAENYVPEQGFISGPDPCRVWLAEKEELPHKQLGQAEELCLSIGRHPDTVIQYRNLLWIAVRGQ